MDKMIFTTHPNVNPFLQRHSAAIRLWHWVTFLLITLSITTVIFNSTLLNPRKNSPQVQSQLKEQGFVLNERQAFSVAHQFDDKLWNLHKYLGIGIAIMLIMRLLTEFSLPAEERIKYRISSAVKLFREEPAQKKNFRHYLIIKWSYVLLYILLIYIALTGLTLAFEHQIELPGNVNHTIKEIHGAGRWAMYTFIIFHIGGVILADLGMAKGIVSGMINGNK
jgi:Ni/Fe-hydrogenase 1 B-type cytochrome subunit